MDVYGYAAWPYTCSDDVSNQMQQQQQQGLRSGVPFSREMAHMPVPSGAPWNNQQMPWGMPDPQRQMVQFTAQTNPLDQVNKKHLLHYKRKPDNIEPPIPSKQLITEDKMAAHLNGLHLSSDYTTHSLCSDNMSESSSRHVMSTDSDELKGKTLVLSKELRNIKTDSLIPTSLIERLEKPCMSLVLWKPEQSILEKITDENKNETDEVKPKRKGLLVDYGTMDVEM